MQNQPRSVVGRVKAMAPEAWRLSYWTFCRHRALDRQMHASDCRAIGPSAARRLRTSTYLPWATASVRLPGYAHPLYFRPRSSDVAVIRQVFVDGQYADVGRLPDIRFIIDCGANIGCAAFYFLHRYPEARAVVVEPDAASLSLCRRNLTPFGSRVMFVQAGVWSASVPLKVVRGSYRDGEPWSFQVRPCAGSEPCDLQGVTIPQLLDQARVDRVDLLKIDIEAAEREVFSNGDLSWLGRVRNIAIELHGEECAAAFRAAMTPFRWREATSGDLTICSRALDA